MPEFAELRVYGQGKVEVELVVAYLDDFRAAYNSILVFEHILKDLDRPLGGFPFKFLPIEFAWALRMGRGGLARSAQFSSREIATLLPRSDQLVLSGAVLQSPGFWDFVGKLNPLEVLRQYLNDRHERRKDREYREDAEKRRFQEESFIRQNEIVSGWIKNARDAGATDEDLAPLVNRLVHQPLEKLDRHQDLGTITSAEKPKPIQLRKPDA